MYQASENLNAAVLGDNRKFRAKIKSGTTEVTGGIRSIKQNSRSVADDCISIGGAVSSYVEIELNESDISFENTEIEVSIGMVLDGSTEWVSLGIYTAQKPTKDDDVVKFTAYDRIQSKMAGAYFSELTYPADGKGVLAEISTKTGVPIDTSSLPDGVILNQRVSAEETELDEDGNQTVKITYVNPLDGYAYRDALSYISQLYGKFATCDRTGTVVFRWYEDREYTVKANRWYDDLVKSENVFTVGALACHVGDTTLISGSGTTTIQADNPVMTQNRLDAVYEQIKDFQFIPAGCSFLGDMRLDVGDIIKITEKSGNIIRIPIMSIVQDFDGGLLTEIQSFGWTEQESTACKGPTDRKFDQLYTDLFKVKELVGNKASFELAYNLSLSVKDNAAQINSQTGRIESLSDRTASLELDTTGIKQSVSEIRTDISGAQSRIETVETLSNQTADKFTWLVKSGTSETDFILTDRTAQLITESLVITNSAGNATIISGGKMDVDEIFAQNITATGTITGANLIGATGSFENIYVKNNLKLYTDNTSEVASQAVTALSTKTNDLSKLYVGEGFSQIQFPKYCWFENQTMFAQTANFTGGVNISGSSVITGANMAWKIKDETITATLRRSGASPNMGLSIVVTDASGNNTFHGLVDQSGNRLWATTSELANKLSLSGGTLTGTLALKVLTGQTGYYAIGSGAQSTKVNVSYINSHVNSSGSYYLAVAGMWDSTSWTNRTLTLSSSDARLKTNVRDSKVSALDTIKQIKIREFDWIESRAHWGIGMVADELETLDPKFSVGGGVDEEGNPRYKSVDQWYMMGYIVKGIQELCGTQLTQETQLNTMQSRIESLQSQLSQAFDRIVQQAREIEELKTKIQGMA